MAETKEQLIERMREIGRKGGQARVAKGFSANRELAVRMGKMGAQIREEKKRVNQGK